MTVRQFINTLLQSELLWRMAFTLSLVAIVYLAVTSEPFPVPSAPSDKINHLIAFTELTILARLAWPARGLLLQITGLLGLGLLLELTQAWLPHRHFSLWDLAADGVGILVGLIAMPLASRLVNSLTC